jgi:polyisoprenoid-binding protein YceI
VRIILFLSILTFGLGQITADWNISADYAVRFSATKAEGTFDKLQGSIQFDPSTPSAAKFDVWVETATISTGNNTKDKHARGSSWLDAEQYPRIGFKSSNFQKTDKGYQVKGKLSIHGITKEVSIPFTFKDQVFAGSLTVNRQDYGIEGPFLFGSLVGDEIAIVLRVPVSRQ